MFLFFGWFQDLFFLSLSLSTFTMIFLAVVFFILFEIVKF